MVGRTGATLAAIVVVATVATGAWWWRDRQRSDRPVPESAVVLLGDSITAGGDWSELLPGVPVVNEGHPGFTTDQLAARIADIGAAQPVAVLVMTGTNDVRDGLPAARTVAGLDRLLDDLAARSPRTTVVVQSILPRRETASQIIETNAALRELAARRGLQYLDLHASFDDGSGGLRAEETTDGWHLSEAGYRRWAGLIAPVVDALVADAR